MYGVLIDIDSIQKFEMFCAKIKDMRGVICSKVCKMSENMQLSYRQHCIQAKNTQKQYDNLYVLNDEMGP
jgi:hypothetical protein